MNCRITAYMTCFLNIPEISIYAFFLCTFSNMSVFIGLQPPYSIYQKKIYDNE